MTEEERLYEALRSWRNPRIPNEALGLELSVQIAKRRNMSIAVKQELLSDVYVRLVRSYSRVQRRLAELGPEEGPPGMLRYVARVITNAWNDKRRGDGRRPPGLDHDPDDPSSGPGDHPMLKGEAIAVAEQLLPRMSPRDQEVVLKRSREQTYEEIEREGLSRSTANRLIRSFERKLYALTKGDPEDMALVLWELVRILEEKSRRPVSANH